MSAKTGSDAPQKSAVAAGLMKPMLISLDFSALITAIEEQNNRIEMLEMQLRKKDEEVAALTASVTVRRGRSQCRLQHVPVVTVECRFW